MNLHVHVWYLHKRCAFLCVLIACVQFGVKAWRIRWLGACTWLSFGSQAL